MPRYLITGTLAAFTLVVAGISSGPAISDERPAFTSEQRRACTPDAFRLCSAHIPSIEGITACMREKKASLSTECKAVFDK